MKLAKAKGYRFMLDSGAFTYRQKVEAGWDEDPDKYFDSYFNFCDRHHELFDVIAEFDIDGLTDEVTVQTVDGWTERMLARPWRQKVMPVYHGNRGPYWLRDWLLDTRSPLVGMGSELKIVGPVIAQAHHFGKFIHGFAQTRINTDLKFTPYDSVDSSSWLRGDRFGNTFIFRNNRFITLDHHHKKDRAIYRTHFEALGLEWAKMRKDDLHSVRCSSIMAWRDLATSFEARWYFKNQGKHPYLYEWAKQGKELPEEHPLLTRARREKKELTLDENEG